MLVGKAGDFHGIFAIFLHGNVVSVCCASEIPRIPARTQVTVSFSYVIPFIDAAKAASNATLRA